MKDKIKILSIPAVTLALFWSIGAIDPSDLDVFANLALPVILTCVIIFFAKKETINSWWYFSLVFWLFVALVIFTGDKSGGTFGLGDGTLIMTGLLAWLYFGISIVIIAVKSWKLRGK